MRTYILALLLMAACSPTDRALNTNDVTIQENKANSVDIPLESENCGCEYYPPENVTLVFKKRTLKSEIYDVEFLVREQSGREFNAHARLDKSCADDFEKRQTIIGTLERKKSGTCSPVFIQPKDYNFPCWRI